MFKPMLASKLNEETAKAFLNCAPLLASPKLDGIRCIVIDGVPCGRSLKPIPNKHVQAMFAQYPDLEGCDGELVVGSAHAPDVYRNTFSGVMAHEGEPDFTFWMFDRATATAIDYLHRWADLKSDAPFAHWLFQTPVSTWEEVLAYEAKVLGLGYEGAMLRRPQAPYKFGRATEKSLDLMKLKRESDDEAEIIGVYEAMENTNEAFTNALGQTERSTHAENKVPKGMVGGFTLRRPDGVEFDCSAGKFTHAERVQLWNTKDTLEGLILKYRHFTHGAKDKPRFPRALGFRSPIDL